MIRVYIIIMYVYMMNARWMIFNQSYLVEYVRQMVQVKKRRTGVGYFLRVTMFVILLL